MNNQLKTIAIPRFENISHLRENLEPRFESNFFKPSTSRFHQDKRKYWSKSNQELVLTRRDGSKVFYAPMQFKDTNYCTLSLVGRSGGLL